jgi:hypothetical protein
MKNLNAINILHEEIQKFLNEAFIMNDDRFKFRQRLNNSSFFNYDSFTTEFDTDIVQSDITVSWTVSFWLNNFGIENFIIDVESVEGTFNLQLIDRQTDQVKQDSPKNINDFEWKYIISDANLAKSSSLYITELDFDFRNKTCSVKF